MDPTNADLLVEIGQKMFEGGEDVREADHYISRAIQLEPTHQKGLELRKQTRELSIALDDANLLAIDAKKNNLQERHLAQLKTNYKLMATLNEQYYQFIYHTIAIEGMAHKLWVIVAESKTSNKIQSFFCWVSLKGNTLTLKEVRDVIQTGKAPFGADVSELSEIVGMEAAIKLVNKTIPSTVTEQHIQQLHQR